MGRALEVGKRIELVLDWDKDKPKETRPVFVAKSFSMREQTAFEEYWQDIADIDQADTLNEFVVGALMMFLVDWKNQVNPDTGEAIPFERGNIQDVLADNEAYELVHKIRFFSQPTNEEKKSTE